MAQIARTLNPAIEIVVRTHNEYEALLLQKERVGTVFYGEHELASAMTSHVLDAGASARAEPYCRRCSRGAETECAVRC
jgi:CPA2 family monovalent cation:H+ antiporter-2